MSLPIYGGNIRVYKVADLTAFGTVWQSQPKSPLIRPPIDRGTRRRKSAVTNGKLLPNVDARSTWARRLRDLISEHIADLGGFDNCSVAERSIVRRASAIEVGLEHIEATFALAGEAAPEALDVYARVSANLRRLLESIGLQRRAKEVPSLNQYLSLKAAQKGEAT